MPTCGTGRRAVTGVRFILLGRSLKVGVLTTLQKEEDIEGIETIE